MMLAVDLNPVTKNTQQGGINKNKSNYPGIEGSVLSLTMVYNVLSCHYKFPMESK